MKFTAIKQILTAAAVGLALQASAHSLGVAVSGTGAPGSEATVSVSLSSDAPLGALQLTLPGMGQAATVSENTATATGRASALSATAGTRSDGSVTLLLYSPAMSAIAAGEGEIATFKVLLADSPVSLYIAPQVKATDTDGNAVECTAQGFTFTVEAAKAEFPSGRAYDFGRVPIRSSYTMTVPVHNAGTVPLTIDAIEFSHSSLSAAEGMLPLTVAPGSTAACDIVFAPEERGTFSATATLSGNSTTGNDVLRILAEPFAVNEIHVGDVSGPSDSAVRIPLTMKNMDAVTGFTLEFELPSWLEYVEGSFALTDRKADHSVTATCSGGKLHATCFSLSDSPFAGNDGEIASFEVLLKGSSSVSLAPSKAVLPAVVAGAVSDVLSATYPGQVSISYPYLGLDTYELSLGRTPVTESATTELGISNWGNAPLIIERILFDGADISHNAELPLTIEPWGSARLPVLCETATEGDLSTRMQIYSNDPERRMAAVNVSATRYAPNELIFEAVAPANASADSKVEVTLDSYDAVSALQFDLDYPTELTPGDPVFTGRAQGFTAEVRTLSPGKMRVFVFSLAAATMAPGCEKIMELPFSHEKIETGKTYNFHIENIKISDAAMSDRHSGAPFYEQSFIYNPSTGVASIEADAEAPAEYYTLDGLRVARPTHGIYLRKQGTKVTKVVL